MNKPQDKVGYYDPVTLSKVLMMNESSVYRLAKDGVIPKSDGGKYALIPSVQGYIKFLRQNTQFSKKTNENFNEARTRQITAQADLLELKLEKERNEVVSVEDLQRTVADLFLEVRTNLRNIPERVSSLIVGETDERKLKRVLLEEIDIVLTSIADGDLKIIKQDEGDDQDEEEAGEY